MNLFQYLFFIKDFAMHIINFIVLLIDFIFSSFFIIMRSIQNGSIKRNSKLFFFYKRCNGIKTKVKERSCKNIVKTLFNWC